MGALIFHSSVLILITCLFNPTVTGDSYFQASCVTSSGNYTANSTYRANLKHIFSNLTSSTTPFNSGFHNFSHGRRPEQVNSISFCRGDVSQQTCTSCLNDTISQLERNCPDNREAVGWSEFCTFRYSNRVIDRIMETAPRACLYNTRVAADVDQFKRILSLLLRNLSVEAAGQGSERKYAAGSATGPGYFVKVYGLVQCTPDLSEEDCGRCLEVAVEAVGNCCEGKVGCRILSPSCLLRYESESFFREAARIPPRRASPPNEGGAGSDPRTNEAAGANHEVPQGKGRDSARTLTIVIASSLVSVLAVVLSIFIVWRLRTQRKKLETPPDDDIVHAESLQFDFATIRSATDNFSEANKLGQGGFGAVYKGRLANGQEIAVKRLSKGSAQGEFEFKNEVLLVAKLQHRNLVRLLGFCLAGNERLLIYEFVPNRSLDHYIFAKDQTKRALLDWGKRYNIIRGISRGLLYLHEDSHLRIIHRDLKASNILLDADMNPKIADFGMARLFISDETQGNTSRIVGTYGYMAPEYAMHGQFSAKSDVYSFGVLVLETVSGQRNNRYHNGEYTELLSHAWKIWRKGTAMLFVDPYLKNVPSNEVLRCIHIALLCVQENAAKRPSMASVLLMLNSYSIIPPAPLEPFCFTDNSSESDMSSSRAYSSSILESKQVRSESLVLSINDASITELHPR